MSIPPLIQLETLAQVREILYQRINQLLPKSSWNPNHHNIIDQALAWALLFEHWPDLLPTSISHEMAFYNRYYWFKRFVVLKQQRDGYDAGLEQQVFHLLEQVDFDLDWTLMERLDAEASQLA